MRQKTFILLAVLLVLAGGGAVAAYAYDSSRETLIADGVSVAGIDVGGMTTSRARIVLTREVEEPLDQPIAVVRAKRRFNLSAEDAGVRAEVDGMVEEALRQSREGNIFTRAARDLTGGKENARVALRVDYDRRAIKRLVGRVKKGLDRDARDAEVIFPSFEQVQEKKGRSVKRAVLMRRLAAALTVPGADRSVTAPVRIIKPKVTKDQLADKYPAVLVADRANFQLRLYKSLRLDREYTVAVGAVGFDTPAGLYHIQNKAVDPAWSVPDSDWAGDLAGTVVPGGVPENPLKARWLGIYDGAGIHGTDQTYSLGSAASHGCIRMAIPDVIELYDQVAVGTPIYIA